MPYDQVATIDLGGTKTAGCLVTQDGVCGQVLTRSTPAMDGPDAVLDRVSAIVSELVDADGAGQHELAGVGVGSAGVIDHATGTVVSATQAIADWPGTPVADGLSQRLNGLPVAVDNDVNAHAVGEAWLGAGRSHDRMFMVTVGTGVGGAVIVHGQPVHGAHHVAGEMGHVPARGAEHLRCACGRRGHVEAISSGPGLLQHFHSLGGATTLTDTRQLVAAADNKDEAAVRAVRDSAVALGRCLAGIATVVDPEVIVIGGGLAEMGARWWQPMEDTLRTEVVDALAEMPLRRAELGGNAALIGAARLAWTNIGADPATIPTTRELP
jgi:glucokinase